MALDDQDAFVVAVAGHVESVIHKQPELALELFDRALVLNENSVFAWGMSGELCVPWRSGTGARTPPQRLAVVAIRSA